MRYSTFVQWQLEDDGSYTLLRRVSTEWCGPVAQCKKESRRIMKDISRFQLEEMKREAAEKWRQLGLAEPTIQELEEETGPGRISRYAAAQMAAERDENSRMFSGLRRSAIRSLGARDLQADRSGLARTTMNQLGLGENIAETAAFRNAMANTLQQRMAALNARLGQRAEAGQSSLASGNLSSDAAWRRAQMGSGWTDALQGIQTGVGIASSLFAPGSGLLRGLGGGGAMGYAQSGGLPLSHPGIRSRRIGSGIGGY